MKIKLLIICFSLSACITTKAQPLATPQERAMTEAGFLCAKQAQPATGDPEKDLQRIIDQNESQRECTNDMYVKLLPSYMQEENNRLQQESNQIQRRHVNATKCAAATSSFEKGMYCAGI